MAKPLPIMAKDEVKREVIETALKSPNKLFVRILSGKNLPKRIGTEQGRPFLEIRYDGQCARTGIGNGSEPHWNELLELPLSGHHKDFLDPNALNGSISINLFDAIEDDRGEESREGQFWLGEVTVPITALATGSNLSGWFELMEPVTCFGYERSSNVKEAQAQQQTVRSPKRLPHREACSACDGPYLLLDLWVSQNIPLLEPNMAVLPSSDSPYIKEHIIKWNELFNSSYPDRRFNALALDTKGRTNCITRYIRPLEPPQFHNDEIDVTLEQCLRYVSLVPFTECSSFYQNVWLTTDQLLSFMVGSVTDHCVTLACFLLALKIDAYLLLGYGIPRGFTGYVLYSEYNTSKDSNQALSYFILDVVNNEKYNLCDPLCPLQRVYCVVNNENIWGNVQRSQNVALLRFDLARRSDWWPVFNDQVASPTNFVNTITNFASSRLDCEHLEVQLEKKLKQKFSKWRPMERTNFNYRLTEALRNCLRSLEINSLYGKFFTDSLVEINKTLQTYDVNGYIFNAPFSSIRTAIKKIKRLNLQVQSQGVNEFSLVTFVQTYPGNVLSVWILIAVLRNNEQ